MDFSREAFSEGAINKIEELKNYYPDKQSAVMPILQLIQEEFAEISEEAITWLATELDMSPVHVRELVTFYTMYTMKKRGKYHFQICRTLSCAVMGEGCAALKDTVQKECQLTEPKQVSANGEWSYEMVECLGSCGSGPMIQINDTYFENLNSKKLEELIKRIAAEQPDLSFSTVRNALGKGFADISPSAFCPERTTSISKEGAGD